MKEIQSTGTWIVLQIGARENYAVARSLKRQGCKVLLITDCWEAGWIRKIPFYKTKKRFNVEILDEEVISFNLEFFLRLIYYRLKKVKSWAAIISHNLWFQKKAIKAIERLNLSGEIKIFSYSYASSEIFDFVLKKKWKAYLGQIDPGKVEADLMDELYYTMSGYQRIDQNIPKHYWCSWQNELAKASTIIVNSAWSANCLQQYGVSQRKIKTIALAYEREAQIAKSDFVLAHQDKSDCLRLLFLGQVNLRKGIDIIFDMMVLLKDYKIFLTIVGPVQINIPPSVRNDSRVKIIGPVSRNLIEEYYMNSDLFLFPTRSDGFGLTQLESIAHGVPIIASRNCGKVVIDGFNGFLLDDLSPFSLAKIVKELVNNPELILKLKNNCILSTDFSLEVYGRELLNS